MNLHCPAPPPHRWNGGQRVPGPDWSLLPGRTPRVDGKVLMPSFGLYQQNEKWNTKLKKDETPNDPTSTFVLWLCRDLSQSFSLWHPERAERVYVTVLRVNTRGLELQLGFPERSYTGRPTPLNGLRWTQTLPTGPTCYVPYSNVLVTGNCDSEVNRDWDTLFHYPFGLWPQESGLLFIAKIT